MDSFKIGFTPKITRRLSKIGIRNNSSFFLSSQSIPVEQSIQNTTFLEPQPLKKAVRKRRQSSVYDPNLSLDESALRNQGKKQRLSRMSSLSAIFSPGKQLLNQFGGMLTRAKSATNLIDDDDAGKNMVNRTPSLDNKLRTSLRRKSMATPMSATQPEPGTKKLGFTESRMGSLRRKALASESMKRSRLWIEKFKNEDRPEIMANLSYWELKRQEVIYELYKGEKYLLKDLHMVQNAYQKGMKCLKLLDKEEEHLVFGHIGKLVTLHQELKNNLKAQRNHETKMTEKVGKVLSDWVDGVSEVQMEGMEAIYIPYMCNQVRAKDLLDSKKASCKELQKFLDLCLQSDFSRKLDLWSFLDVPRSKLMKYPLLLKSILKQTSEGNEDRDHLPLVIKKIEDIIQSIDQKTGEANCMHVLKKLEFIDERQHQPFLDQAKTIQCQGELKNNRGTKLFGFLFDTGFLLTRIVETDDGTIRYRVHKQPISSQNLMITDSSDEKKSSSFSSAFNYANQGKTAFQVLSVDEKDSFILMAANEHDKREWLQRLREVKEKSSSERLTSKNITSDDADTAKIKSEEIVSAIEDEERLDASKSVIEEISLSISNETADVSDTVFTTPRPSIPEFNIVLKDCNRSLDSSASSISNSKFYSKELKRSKLCKTRKQLKSQSSFSPISDVDISFS